MKWNGLVNRALEPPTNFSSLELGLVAHFALVGRRCPSSPYRIDDLRYCDAASATWDGGPPPGLIQSCSGPNAETGRNRCFVAVRKDAGRVAGYYTFCVREFTVQGTPGDPACNARARTVPVCFVDHMDVFQPDLEFALFDVMVIDAIRRALMLEAEMHSVLANTTNIESPNRLDRLGFCTLPDAPSWAYFDLECGNGRIGVSNRDSKAGAREGSA